MALTQGVALGYKYYALSGHVFVRLNGSEIATLSAKGERVQILSKRCINQLEKSP
jgi:hypothetical protein